MKSTFRMNAIGLLATQVLGLGVGGARGQDLEFRSEIIATCLLTQSGEMRSACVGIAANDCQTINDGGGTTVGMGFCYGREGEWWDARLNDAYSQLMKREQADDAEFAGMASAPVKAPALREMQRQWIAYRDSLCEYEAVQWGGGTGAGPAYSTCLVVETARQYFVLSDRLAS